jgi:hypothetical protein
MSRKVWLQSYNNDEIGRSISAINSYRKGTMSHIIDNNWKRAELERYHNEIRDLHANVPKNYVSIKEKKNIIEHLNHLGKIPKSSQTTPNGQGGTRKSKLSKPKYRSHIRTHSRVRTVKSKSKSKTKRQQKK